MPKIMNPEGSIVDLAGANALIEKIATLTSESDALRKSLEDAEAARVAAETKLSDLESQISSLGTDLAAETEALAGEKSTVASLEAALVTLTEERDALKTELEAASAAAEETRAKLRDELETVNRQINGMGEELTGVLVERDQAVSKLEALSGALGVQGEIPTDVVTEDESAVSAAEKARADEIRSRYSRLSRSLKPADRREARRLLATHGDEIRGLLAKVSDEPEPEVAKPGEDISADEWADFNEWVGIREFLMSKKASALPTGERNKMAAESRIRYAKNKDLYDRCLKARE
jgi:DNA repair exonuclease SbcCD ATPase subunit